MKKVMSLIVILCFFILSILLSSCAQLNTPNGQQSQVLVFNGMILAQDSAMIYSQYSNVATIITNQAGKMESADVESLQKIKTNFDLIKQEFQDLETGKVSTQSVAIDYNTFYNTVTNLNTDYNIVVGIVNKYSSLFSASDMAAIVRFESFCNSLNNEVAKLQKQISNNSTSAQIVTDITQILQDVLIIANTISVVATVIK